ncbi:MAG TPA: hypothetical protein PLF13_09480 [candidate division Zixibacteria bacterium]|nr:hypothetical protein [candidate division Zixibacteria bacterium]
MRFHTKLCGLAVTLLVILLAGAVSAEIVLPKGHPVKVVFDKDVSSKDVKAGDLVPIRLFTPIDFGGIILVREGATGTARVVDAQKNGTFGKAGFVEVELVELDSEGFYEAADGKKIQLTAKAGPLRAEGKSKKTISFILGFGLLIKGTNGVLPAQQPIEAELSEDIILLNE